MTEHDLIKYLQSHFIQLADQSLQLTLYCIHITFLLLGPSVNNICYVFLQKLHTFSDINSWSNNGLISSVSFTPSLQFTPRTQQFHIKQNPFLIYLCKDTKFGRNLLIRKPIKVLQFSKCAALRPRLVIPTLMQYAPNISHKLIVSRIHNSFAAALSAETLSVEMPTSQQLYLQKLYLQKCQVFRTMQFWVSLSMAVNN